MVFRALASSHHRAKKPVSTYTNLHDPPHYVVDCNHACKGRERGDKEQSVDGATSTSKVVGWLRQSNTQNGLYVEREDSGPDESTELGMD